ncbi:MAG: AarF/UbiB family protein [Betaproteobacteria bacterium]
MIFETIEATRDIARLYEIGSVLVRHGFGDLAQRTGIARLLENAGRTLHLPVRPAEDVLTTPQRIRRALEEMGPTFVKLGQILSTRVDVFPPEWIAEFENLQDHAAPVPYESVRAQLVTDLGANPEDVFVQLDPQPLAAGSIAQVHRAQLQDGTPVVLKVRRPGIEAVVEADLRLLRRLAELAERDWPALQRYQPREIVRQFAASLKRELDLRSECRNAERIASNLALDANIVIPQVFWQWTTPRLNVQAHIAGIAGRDLEAVDAAGLDRPTLARRGANAVLKMVIEDGFFHADPHPGNVFYLPDNRIALIDFGMVGHLSVPRRHQLADLLFGLAQRDSERVAELLTDWANKGDADVAALCADLDCFIDEFHGVPLEQIDVGHLLAELTRVMRDHALMLPADLALLFKAVISLEGLGRLLDPQFDMVSVATPFLMRVQRQRNSPRAMARVGAKSLREAMTLIAGLPGDLRRLIKTVDRGGVTIRIDVVHLDRASSRIDRSVSRLTMGIVTAALIIGSSITMTVQAGSTWFGLPFFGLLGFVGATVGGVWLLSSIRRSARNDADA